jgi:hypothetical protein
MRGAVIIAPRLVSLRTLEPRLVPLPWDFRVFAIDRSVWMVASEDAQRMCRGGARRATRDPRPDP